MAFYCVVLCCAVVGRVLRFADPQIALGVGVIRRPCDLSGLMMGTEAPPSEYDSVHVGTELTF